MDQADANAERATSSTPIEQVFDIGVEVGLEHDPKETSMPPPELAAIARLGRHELLGRMAVGGMAEIFLARERAQAGGSRHVVVKVMRPQLSGNAELDAMFVNEGRVALRLKHPNICHVYEFGLERGRRFIAMEYVHGVTLRELERRASVRGERIAIPVLVGIAAHVAEALHAAHQAKDAAGRPLMVVHRDVSPHNVMIGFDGVVKLLDFGVAHARTGIAGAERSGTIKGKLGYLAPEQCVGGPVDARTDVFALGVCLWEGLTGKRLFRRDDDAESLRAIVQEEAPEPSSTGVDVPIRLSAIVLRALERDPKKRFASAAELQDALEQYLIDERERVGSARLARYVYDLFGDRVSAPPVLDRSPEIVEWLASGEDAAPRSRKRVGAWMLAGAGLLAAAIVVGIAAGRRSVEQEQRAAPAQPNAQLAAWSAPPASAPPPGAPAATSEPPIEPTVAGETTPAPDETQRAVRHRRRPVPGGFVHDPGF